MIEYLRGELAELTPTMATVDCGGVGYGANISLSTYTDIQGKKDVKLYIYEAIREDAFNLFGFSTKEERELFLHLISVSGIGGNTARVILSTLNVQELITAISSGDVNAIKSVKGIGLKTAQRIIVDLKDKIDKIGAAMNIDISENTNIVVNTTIVEETISALTVLGFSPAASQKVVNQIVKENPNMKVQEVIKESLKRLR